MLSLDDPLWNQLEHAYGKASDIPDLLRKLALSTAPSAGNTSEQWYRLWSSLCHQGDVYTASYAAVPHIVKIASSTATPVDFSFFQFPAAVEVARRGGRGPEIPEQLGSDYHQALAHLSECVSIHRNDAWDRPMLLSAAAAQAVAKGHIDIAGALLNLDNDWIAEINNRDFAKLNL